MFENYFFTNRIIYIPRKDEHQKYLVTFLNPKIKKVDNDCWKIVPFVWDRVEKCIDSSLRRKRQPWFGHKACAGLRPRREGSRPVEYRVSRHKPKCQRAWRKALFSRLRETGSQVCRRTRTMPVGHPGPRWPVRSRPTSQPRLSVCSPTANSPAETKKKRNRQPLFKMFFIKARF